MPDDKSDNRIAVTTQGRSSKPVDMVIEQTDRSVWVNHGSSAELQEELKLEKVESKLSERQSLVLTLVNSLPPHWPIDSLMVSQQLADEFSNKYSSVSALSTLTQLHKKGLIKRQTFSTVTRGNVAAFYPRNWEACHTMSVEKFEWLQNKLKEFGIKT